MAVTFIEKLGYHHLLSAFYSITSVTRGWQPVFFFFFALLVSSASRLFLAHLSLSLSVVVGGGGRASILLLPPRSLPTQPPLDPARCTSGVVSSLPLFLYARRARRRQLAGEEGKAVLKRHKGCPHALKGNDASAWRWWFESW